MANEFKIKKGLIVTGASGGTVVDIQGSQGQLFSVTDNLSGSIFAVSDISGVPIFDVNSSGLSTFDGNVNLPDSKKILLGTGNDFQLYHDGTHGVLNNTTGNLYTSALGSMMFRTSLNVTALTLDASQNATFEGTIDSGSITSTGTVSADTYFESTDASLVLGTTGAGTIFLRPNGIGSGTGAMSVSSSGTISTGGIIDMNSNKITELSPGTTNLDAVNYQQLQDAIAGVLVYQGTWNASTNTPTLTSGVGTPGYYYIVSVAGSTNLDGITDWLPGDWAIFSDLATDAWQKIDHTNVLNGAGTGQKVTKWDGSGTSYALTDGPITFNGNDSTFAGNVIAEGSLITRSSNANLTISGDSSGNVYYNNTAGEHRWRANGSSVNSMNLSSTLLTVNENATFTSNVYVGSATTNGGVINLIQSTTNPEIRIQSGESGATAFSIYNTATNPDAEQFFINNNLSSSHLGNARGALKLEDSSGTALTLSSGNATFTGRVTAVGFTSTSSNVYTGGMSTFETTLTNNEDWQNSPISILERGNVQATQTADKYAPNLNFHWGGVVSKSLWMGYNGHLNWGEYSATGIPADDGRINATFFGGELLGTINTATTGVTQTAGNNSTLIATTAYADAAAAAVPIGNYLPLSAGSSYPLTGILYLGNVGSDQKIQFQRTGGNVYSIEHDSAKLYFYNRTTTEAPLVIQNDGDVLLNGGKVGIGTTSPDAKLEVRTDSGAAVANSYFRVTAGAQGAYGGAAHFEGAYNDYGNVDQPNIVGKIDMASEVVTSTDVGGIMKFFTKATGGTYATAPLERMRIDSRRQRRYRDD